MANRKIGAADTQKLLIYAAVIGGGYFFVLKPLLIKLGIMQDPALAAQSAAQSQNVSDYVTSAVANQTPTKSRGEWQLIADSIYTDLSQTVINNRSDAVYQLARPQNDADVALLIDTFGQRQQNWFGINAGSTQTLPAFVTQNLTSSDLATVNNNYQRKGIKFQF
jgi:hypothetical protein